MKISGINSGSSFGRIIKICSNSPSSGHCNSTVKEVADALNSRKTNYYTSREAAQIRDFFQSALGDYNGKDGITVTEFQGEAFLLSGKDAARMEALRENKKIAYELTKNAYLTRTNKKKLIDSAKTDIKKFIKRNVENGLFGKPDSSLNFKVKKVKGRYRVNDFEYLSITEAKVKEVDGTITLADSSYSGTVDKEVSGDYKSLHL